MKNMCNVSFVIGSWGSYNECNDRALGSKWLELSDYDNWEEIETELKNEGFELDGLDEELFIQDIEGLPTDSCNWDNTNPQELFELLKEADVLDNDYKYEVMCAYLDVRNFSEFEQLIRDYGSNWNDDIYLYKGFDWSDYGQMLFEECCYKVPEPLEQFIDFEAYGRYMGNDYAEEYCDGIIEICR
jgi:hypothetical protein